MKRMPLILTLLALAALSASIAYWVLQLYKPEQRPLAAVPVAAIPEPAVDAGATLFGGQAAGVVASNYQLTGVVAAGRNSVAILVAEGQPPKTLVVGKEIAPGVTVMEVHPRYVMLSEGGVPKRIELAIDSRPAADMSAPPVPMPTSAPAMPDQQPVQQQPQPQPPPTQGDQPVPAPGQVPEPQPPAPIARPSEEQAAPPPAQPVQMPPPTRTIGVPGQPPVAQ